MIFSSIRWRLPASYAAVALLAAFSLGLLMLLVLHGYYTRQERAFLLGNAEAARATVEQILLSGQPTQTLQEQVRGLAFLAQAQIRVVGADGSVLADSDIPGVNQVVTVTGGSVGLTALDIGEAWPEGGSVTGAVSTTLVESPTFSSTAVTGSSSYVVSVNSSPFGYGFTEATAPEIRRSNEVVSVPLVSSVSDNQPMARLEISHGPAYGTEILRSVALAWLAASLAAVALAGLAGMIASRQVTGPVLALTGAARQMQYGDLSSRATLQGKQPAQEFSTLAETFNQMAQRVEETVSTLRAFVSDAAHELNTPLTALHTNLELALNEPEGNQRELFLQRAIEQNTRLEHLVNGLLDLSRLEAAHSAPEFETLDLARLAADLGERFASRAEQAERSFTIDLPASPLLIRGNPRQIERMLDNLLENALKFTPAGGVIRLNLQSQENQAVLCVSDSGIGIPAEDLPHLCERFHRGRNSAAYPGTGLGLAIVKAIVDLHGGQVEAHSSGPGQGSQFTIHLAIQPTATLQPSHPNLEH